MWTFAAGIDVVGFHRGCRRIIVVEIAVVGQDLGHLWTSAVENAAVRSAAGVAAAAVKASAVEAVLVAAVEAVGCAGAAVG